MSSKFFTNGSDRSHFDKFTGIIESMRDLYAFHAVVGYFRSSGYFKLQPYLGADDFGQSSAEVHRRPHDCAFNALGGSADVVDGRRLEHGREA